MAEPKNPSATSGFTAPECVTCGTTALQVQLQQCRICHRRFCDECAYRSRTGLFCSENCSRRFFFGDIDLEDLDEEDFEDRDYDE